MSNGLFTQHKQGNDQHKYKVLYSTSESESDLTNESDITSESESDTTRKSDITSERESKHK